MAAAFPFLFLLVQWISQAYPSKAITGGVTIVVVGEYVTGIHTVCVLKHVSQAACNSLLTRSLDTEGHIGEAVASLPDEQHHTPFLLLDDEPIPVAINPIASWKTGDSG